ncbi:cyclophilin-like fold protein [Puia dinghuensis]|uniref:Cyclophilin-like domain-containing protein n=1 Tax=Puia dinghuensis TaxID=1792502 RepID=A0A8J2U7Z2_9BACT|nr:cyclophilin-like fold protein [Puia dinghuensis]GGA85063.1 hypothetical protein GCM10011511_05110 [Puia dinghuensis]
MRIKITSANGEWTATLNSSAAAKDFASLLPLKLVLNDYNGTEKIADLPKRLVVDGAPEGSAASEGDLTYYAPWGNLAIFYKGFGYSRGLVIIGKMDGGAQALRGRDPLPVTIMKL